MADSENQKAPITYQQEQLDLHAFLLLLGMRKNFILVCLFVTVVIVMIVSLLSPRQYEATAKIWAEPPREVNPYLLEQRSQEDRRMFLETQKEIVVSNSVVRKTLADLAKKPEDSISQKEIDQFLKAIKIQTRASMKKNIFAGNGIGESGVFFITVRSSHPEKAKESTNTLVNNYLSTVAELRIDRAKIATNIFENTVSETVESLEKVLQSLVDFEHKTGSLLPELLNIDKPSIRVFDELPSIRKEYELQKTDIAKKQHFISSLEKSLNEKGEIPIPMDMIVSDPTITVIKNQLATLHFKLNELEPFYTDESRNVSSLMKEIENTENSLKREIKLMIEGEKQSLSAMEKGLAQTKAILDDYDSRMSQLSLFKGTYSRLKQEYEGWVKAMDMQIQRLAEARIAAAESSSQVANIVVIDRAIANPSPVSPRLKWNFFISLLIGLGIGFLLVFLELMLLPVPIQPNLNEPLSDEYEE
ncbi:hypothetical protein JW926_05945 [Candidatus Sumerlaeota bacterium]|nr:hypothetical protein [Candidatus Sumerlaeota bacterium]